MTDSTSEDGISVSCPLCNGSCIIENSVLMCTVCAFSTDASGELATELKKDQYDVEEL